MRNPAHRFFKQIENWCTGRLRSDKKFVLGVKLCPRLNLEPLEERLIPAVFNVNSLEDILNPPAGVVTLRSAIQAANATPGGNTINLTVGGTYKITIPGTGENQNATGDFDILPSGGDLIIQNTSGQAVTVDGNHLDRVFNINPGDVTPSANITVTFGGPEVSQGFTITGGVTAAAEFGPGSGGGIEDHGNVNLTLDNMLVTGNSAQDDGGGVAMWNDTNASWTLTISHSTISNNRAGDAGGGVSSNGAGKIVINAGTVITGNFAYNQGGGIWLDSIGFASANLDMDSTFVSNNQAFSVIGIAGGLGNDGNGAVTITNSTITNNSAGTTGGGFGDRHGQGSLTILDSLFSSNTAVGNGGGIAAGGPFTSITNSEIDGNSSTGGNGGGLFANGTTLIVQSSTLANNTANGSGGGIELATNGTQPNGSTLTDVTITGDRTSNHADANGGGVDAGSGFTGDANLLNDTINANSATNGGGIFWAGVANSHFLAENTILAQNSAATDPDASNPANTFTDLGGNLIGISGTGSGNTGFAAASTQTGTTTSPLDPLLGPLQNNGGPTIGAPGTAMTLQTEAPLRGSPVIDKGILAGAPATDERGFPGAVDGLVDVGGAEVIYKTGTSTVMLVSTSAVAWGKPITLTANVTSGAGGSDTVTGNVTFLDQGTPLATLALSGGTATWTSSSLSLGGHALSAAYRGDANHTSSRSAAVAVMVGTPDERFIGNLYQSLLHRQPEAAGLAAWTAALNQGVSRFQVAFAFTQSLEYHIDQVQALYQQLLHRNVDPSGLNTYATFLAAGGTVEQVGMFLTSSAEYWQVRAGGTDNGFVTALYQDVLQRAPDAAGLAVYTHALQLGASRLQVAAAFFGSVEYQYDLVGNFYASFLKRAADSGGLNTFVRDLRAGVPDPVIMAAILGSDEFFALG